MCFDQNTFFSNFVSHFLLIVRALYVFYDKTLIQKNSYHCVISLVSVLWAVWVIDNTLIA